jgi:hypothetical protein
MPNAGVEFTGFFYFQCGFIGSRRVNSADPAAKSAAAIAPPVEIRYPAPIRPRTQA